MLFFIDNSFPQHYNFLHILEIIALCGTIIRYNYVRYESKDTKEKLTW